MPDNNNQSPEVAKITSPITPIGLTDKINEVIDALAAIQISAATDIDGGLIGDNLDNEIDGGEL